MDLAELYAAGHERHLTLTAELTEADGAVPVPACPGWTVKDVYAHLAGAATDVVAGRTEDAPSDAWTARQVAERRDRSLADVVAELAEGGPKLVEALRAFPVPQLPIDQWTHEQDVRGALGRPGNRDVPVVAWAVERGLARNPGWAAKGRPTVLVVGSTAEHLLGEGEPVATLEADDFELLRALLGRRSPNQWRAMARPGSDPAALDVVASKLPIFGPRPDDLHE